MESSDDEAEHFHTEEVDHVKDRKFIIFVSNLDELVVVDHCFTSLFGTKGLQSDIVIR